MVDDSTSRFPKFFFVVESVRHTIRASRGKVSEDFCLFLSLSVTPSAPREERFPKIFVVVESVHHTVLRASQRKISEVFFVVESVRHTVRAAQKKVSEDFF